MSLKRFKSQNNFRVLLYKLPYIETVSIRLDVRTGSIYEGRKNAGISHLLEHWLHQGNSEFPSFRSFIADLEKKGIYQNGVTDTDGSYYYVKSPSDNFEHAFKSLFNLTTHPIFPKEREEHVRQVVLNEYYDYWRKPESKFWRNFYEKRFIDNPPFLNDALGSPENIQSITIEEIKSWYERFYTPGNMLLTIVGNFDEKRAKEMIESTYAKLNKSSLISYPEVSEGNYSDFLVHHAPENRDQIELAISFPTFGWKDNRKKSLTLSLVETIVGGSGYSRLFQTLREEKNLVYNIRCSSYANQDRGAIEITALLQGKSLEPSLSNIKSELDKLSKEGIDDDDFEVAKNIQKSLRVFNMETPEGIGQYFISYEIWEEEIWSPERLVEEINKIKATEVNELISELFDYSKVNVGLFGNIEQDKISKINDIFRIE